MMHFRRIVFVTSLVAILLLSGSGCNTNKPGVMVVAGGHGFDTVEFVNMLNDIEGYIVDTVMQPRANRMIASGEAEDYDIIVFYDMWPQAGEKIKAGYLDLLEKGKGMVFLHHSLVSYQEWDEFKSIVGGRYYTLTGDADSSILSTYKHDLQLKLHIENNDHPVTMGMDDFIIMDEGYGNIAVNKDVEVLLTTEHPDCSKTVGWTHTYGNAEIVYLMSGHDKHAFRNENFRKLLKIAMDFVCP